MIIRLSLSHLMICVHYTYVLLCRELKRRQQENENVREHTTALEDMNVNKSVLEEENARSVREERQRQLDRSMELSNRDGNA